MSYISLMSKPKNTAGFWVGDPQILKTELPHVGVRTVAHANVFLMQYRQLAVIHVNTMRH